MGFVSILKDIGKAPLKVLSWLASPTGQTVVGIAETGVEVLVPASASLIGIFNRWMQEALKVETMAAGAAAGVVKGTDKAAAVIGQLTPEILAFCAANKLDIPDAAKVQEINTLVVALLNSLGRTT